MISISKFISQELKEGLRKIKVLVRGKNDTQISFESMPFGEDSVPPIGYRALHLETGKKGKTVIVGYINKAQSETLKEGEKRIFSLQPDGETLSTFIYLKDDGTMEICGSGDFMVRYNELETAFNQLKSDLDDLKDTSNANSSAINTFASSYVPGGPASVGLPPTFVYNDQQGSASTADITPAKIDEIETKPIS